MRQTINVEQLTLNKRITKNYVGPKGTDVRISTHADATKLRISSVNLRRRINTVMFTSRWAWPARWPIRPILGFWGSKVQKLLFPALDEIRNCTNSAHKTNSKRYIHTLPIGTCGSRTQNECAINTCYLRYHT